MFSFLCSSIISMSLFGCCIFSLLLYFSLSCSTSCWSPFGSLICLSWISSFMDSLLSIGSIWGVGFCWFGV